MKNHVVLYQPVMPANTGNIARTCIATNTALHLIHPLGFETSDRMLKRAGLDYWEHAEIYEHESLGAFLDLYGGQRLYLISKHGHQLYTEPDYQDSQQGEDLFFIFGNETYGLPNDLLQAHQEHTLRLPMNDDHVRSLNLSNAAAIVVYEALRQQAWQDLDLIYHYRDTDKSRSLNW